MNNEKKISLFDIEMLIEHRKDIFRSIDVVRKTISLVPQKINMKDVYSELKSILGTVNHELFGYTFVNVANSQIFLDEMKIKQNITFEEVEIVKKAITRWANEAEKKLCMDEIIVSQGGMEAQFVKEDTIYVLMPGNLGDTFLACIWMMALKKQSQKRICVIVKEKQEIIPQWFDGVDEILVSTKLVDTLSIWVHFHQLAKLPNFLYAFPKADENHVFYSGFWEELSKCNFVEYMRRECLGLSDISEIEEPKYTLSNQFELIHQYGLDEKTVFLFPEANSSMELPRDFWINLARMLMLTGYKVIVNSKLDKYPELEQITYAFESVENTVTIGKNVGWIIGLRSGMCDLLSLSDTPMITIDTTNTYFYYYKLNEMFHKNHISCLWGGEGCDYDELLSDVMKIVHEKATMKG